MDNVEFVTVLDSSDNLVEKTELKLWKSRQQKLPGENIFWLGLPPARLHASWCNHTGHPHRQAPRPGTTLFGCQSPAIETHEIIKLIQALNFRTLPIQFSNPRCKKCPHQNQSWNDRWKRWINSFAPFGGDLNAPVNFHKCKIFSSVQLIGFLTRCTWLRLVAVDNQVFYCLILQGNPRLPSARKARKSFAERHTDRWKHNLDLL